jgi:3-isopropylmalate/(R)-2-methylmalate dehydratase small subunit
MYNCGMMAIELPAEKIDMLFSEFSGKDCEIEVDIDNSKIIVSVAGETKEIDFNLAGFDETLVRAGGWVEYADKTY